MEHLAQLQAGPGWQDPLVIVGAGPVGMCAALGLTAYGIPCVVLDDDTGPATEGSRAIFMERHSLEILGAWSPVGQEMAERGITLTAGHVFFRTRELYKTFSTPPDPNIRYPRFVNFPQNTLEQLEYAALQTRKCCQVRWQHKVIGITQDDEGVTVEILTPNGTERMRAPYVLACDGPRSTMRRLLGLDFPGESRDHHFLILDVRTKLDTPRERWFWFDPPFNPGRTALLHPQPEGIYRIDYQLAPDEDLEAVKDPEALHRRIIATIGDRPYEVVWMSVYTYHQRALERFKHRRVLFLGDAAHLMSPFGGRGLNSGIQDAWNLVWKLALVRAGRAPEALLDTYHDERHPAALENLRLTADTMRFLVPQPGLTRWKRDAILRLSVLFPFMRKHVNAGHMSNPSVYRGSPLVSEDADPHVAEHPNAPTPAQRAAVQRFLQGPIAGALAPEMILIDAATGQRISLLDLYGHSFVVFYFCANPDEGAAALERVRPQLADVPITFFVISSRAPRTTLPERISCLLDLDGKAAAAFAAVRHTLYLVRPDRHIAARRLCSDLNELPALLQRAIGAGRRA